jgi:5'-nucleotidase
VAQILLTNDDGIDSEGLRALEACLQGVADLVTVAPDRERSAVSHGLTIRSALTLERVADHRYSLDGTPADCVIYALGRILQQPPALVISGINRGANLGDDLMYSGTVAAAREASRHGVPALAVSQAIGDAPVRFERGAKFTRTLVRTMLEHRPNGGLCLNVNIPPAGIRGVRLTRQGCSVHMPHFGVSEGREGLSAVKEAESRKVEVPLDTESIMAAYISITPLQRDSTDYVSVSALAWVTPHLSLP